MTEEMTAFESIMMTKLTKPSLNIRWDLLQLTVISNVQQIVCMLYRKIHLCGKTIYLE